MDLALHLGTSVDSLRRSMTERELYWWAEYRCKNWLPLQRIEWYLARLTQMIAATMGGMKDTETSDFLLVLDKPRTVDEAVDEIEQSWPHP